MSTTYRSSIIHILKPNGEIAGAGFVLTDRLAVTCAHVVEAAQSTSGQSVCVVFHHNNENRVAQVDSKTWRESIAEDVAFLYFDDDAPAGVEKVVLGSSRGLMGHPFETFGFPSIPGIVGLPGNGTVVGETIFNGHQVLTLHSSQITPGFSGAPVYDNQTRRVIGMVNAITKPDSLGRLLDTVLITPSETLQNIFPALHLSNICPYRELEAFTESDAEFFFGREKVVEGLLKKLMSGNRFLAVLGPSGSGKSSVVQAGLIPALRKREINGCEKWETIVIRPANQPYERLADAGLTNLDQGLIVSLQNWHQNHLEKTNLLIVIDQFEELLVDCPETVKQNFFVQLANLLEYETPLAYVVITLRDDFFSRIMQHAGALSLWLTNGLVHVSEKLTRNELVAIIQKPAEMVGLSFESGLVEAILNDALEISGHGKDGAPGIVLPLLEFTLTQLWEQKRDGYFSHENYHGLTGNLSKWAENAYFKLSEDQWLLAERIFTSLVHLGDKSQGVPDSRRIRLVTDVTRNETERKIVAHFSSKESRLLVVERDLEQKLERVEIIHDALLREWERLQDWIERDRQFLSWRQNLEPRVRAWVKSAIDENKRDESMLIGGNELIIAENWFKLRNEEFTDFDELLFVKNSSDKNRQEITKREEQSKRELKLLKDKAEADQLSASKLKIRAWLIGGIGVVAVIAAVVALIFGFAASAFGIQSNQNAATATFALGLSQIRGTEVANQVKTAQAASTQSVAFASTAQAAKEKISEQQKLAIARQLAFRSQLSMEQEIPVPDSQVLRASNETLDLSLLLAIQSLKYYSTTEGIQTLDKALRLVRSLVTEIKAEKGILDLKYSPNGEYILSSSYDPQKAIIQIEVWSPTSLNLLNSATLQSTSFIGSGGIITLNDSGTELAINTGKDIAILEVPSLKPVLVENEYLWNFQLSPTGNMYAFIQDSTLVLRETKTKKDILVINDVADNSIVFNPDETKLVFCKTDGLIVWDIAQNVEILKIPVDNVSNYKFDHNGKKLGILTDGDFYLLNILDLSWLWDTPNGGQEIHFSIDDANIAILKNELTETGDWLSEIQVLDGINGTMISKLRHNFLVSNIVFSSDNRTLVSSGHYPENHNFPHSKEAVIWDFRTGGEEARLYSNTIVSAATFSNNGEFILTGDASGNIRFWKSQPMAESPSIHLSHDFGGGMPGSISRNFAAVTGIAFSPDGKYVATGGRNGQAKVWNVQTGQEIASVDTMYPTSAIVFHPTKYYLATAEVVFQADFEPKLRIWDLSTGKVIFEKKLELDVNITRLCFDPSGNKIIAVEDNNQTRIWDVSSGQLYQTSEIQIQDWLSNTPANTSPDGLYAARILDSNIFSVFEVQTKREILRYSLDNGITSWVFSPDNERIAVASDRGSAWIFIYRSESLQALACKQVQRNLTNVSFG